jgi:hypothetical protein
MLERSVAAAAITLSLLSPFQACALTLDIRDQPFACTINWTPSETTFSGECTAPDKNFSVTGNAPYVDEHANIERDNAFAATTIQDGVMAYRLRIRLLLTSRDDTSQTFKKRGQVITDVFFWNVKDCRNAPSEPPVVSSCWMLGTPWHVQGEMRAE